MSFQPLVGQGGYAGWRLLNRTAELQKGLIARDPVVARSHAHLRANIAKLSNADDLVSDYRLLSTTLKAFGLENDINSRVFIRRILESDLDDRSSLANRLADKRYRKLAEAFRFDKGASAGSRQDLAETIVERHVAAELESRVGTVDGNLRLALNAQRELPALAGAGATDNTMWYTILGSPPLRKVVEGAFGMSSAFARLPLDRQLQDVKERAGQMFGTESPKAFANPQDLEKLIQRFLLRAQAVTPVQSSYGAALALLS